MKKVIGWLMIIGLFVGFFVFVTLDRGLAAAVTAYAITFVTVFFIVVAVCLIHE